MSTEWFEDWFGSEYLELYAHRNAESASAEVSWLTKELKLGTASRVLDVACGAGRHLSALMRISLHCFGGDLSMPLLKTAASSDSWLEGRLLRYDMRSLPFANDSFDAVVSLFTSFGYFADDLQHLKSLKEIARILKPNGTFLFDFLNSTKTIRELVPETKRSQNGKLLIEKRSYNLNTRRIEKQIEIKTPTSEKNFIESVRAYSELEISDLFKQAGLKIIKQFGSLAGAPFNSEADRLIVIAVNE